MLNGNTKKLTGVLLVMLLALAMVLIFGSVQKSYAASNSSEKAGYTAYIRKVNPGVSTKAANSMAGHFIKYGDRYNLNERYLMAMAQCESTFNQKAHNPAGYYGLLQTTPTLGAKYAGCSAVGLLKAENSIHTGAAYLKYNLNYFGNNYYKAISGYVNGTGAVRSGHYNGAPARQRIAIKKNIDRFMKSNGYGKKSKLKDNLA